MSQLGSNQGNNDDARGFQELLVRLHIPSAFFIRSVWQGDQLGAAPGTQDRPEISGVRLYAWDPRQPGGVRERECQTDLGDLVRALRKLRREPAWESVVLSKDHARGRQPGVEGGRRVRFGLERGAGGRAADVAAAGQCHRRLVQAIRKSGFTVEHPRQFDRNTGMVGLEEWADTVRLRPQWRPSPWLLLSPLLVLVLFLVPWQCSPTHWGGIPVTMDFIVIVDRSNSMAQSFPNVQHATKRLLNEMQGRRHASLIFFDATAESVWGEMKPLTHDAARELAQRLDAVQPRGGTNLRTAISQAAKEIIKHQKSTTLLIFTDGEDPSVSDMVNHPQEVKSLFAGVEVIMHATTPRLLLPSGSAQQHPSSPQALQPVNPEEETLAKLCHFFNGQFGPSLPSK